MLQQIHIKPPLSVIMEMWSLKHAAPSIVSRVALLNTNDETLSWENYVEMWLAATKIRHNQQACIRRLIELYIPPLILQTKIEFQYVVHIAPVELVKSVCWLLDALITNENVPKHDDNEDKLIEKYFVFALIWAFGSALTPETKQTFNRWWRENFKNVGIPNKGTVFDYIVRKGEFRTCMSCLEEEKVDLSINMASSTSDRAQPKRKPQEDAVQAKQLFVPTAETMAAGTICELAACMHVDLLLVGPNGSGKTAILKEVIEQLPEHFSTAYYQVNCMTNAHTIQDLIEANLEKKAGENYGPIGAKCLAFFLDDLNLETSDAFEGHSGLELLRQLMDYKTWYDRNKYSLKLINNAQLVTAMNPTRGKCLVNDRLLRHFFVFYQSYSAASLTTIFSTVIKSQVEHHRFETKCLDDHFIKKVVLCIVDVQAKVKHLFQKNIETFHYDFNLRHQLSVIRGMALADTNGLKLIPAESLQQHFVSLWAHETQRVYRDNLVSQSAYTTFDKLLRDVMKRVFKDLEQAIILAEPFIFSSSWRPDFSTYHRSSSMDELAGRIDSLSQKGHNCGVPNLVLFDVSIRCVVKVARLIRLGHSLIVSDGGYGKQSFAKLAAYLEGYSVSTLDSSSLNSGENVRTQIRDVFMKIGLHDEKILMLATESTFSDERIFVPISEILTTGFLSNAFEMDDKKVVERSMSKSAWDNENDPVQDAFFKLFQERVQNKIRLCLCLTPGQRLRSRISNFPAILTSTQVCWIQSLPNDEVLQGIAEKILSGFDVKGTTETVVMDLPSASTSPQSAGVEVAEATQTVTLKVVANMLSASFKIVRQFIEDEQSLAKKSQRVTVFLRPKAFIDHVGLFKAMIKTERTHLSQETQNLTKIIEKLRVVNENLQAVEDKLTQKAVEIDAKQQEEDKLLTLIRNATDNMEEEQAMLMEENKNLTRLTGVLLSHQESCASILAVGEPALRAVTNAIKTIKSRDLIEMKANPKAPHVYVTQVLFAMLALRQVPQKSHNWETCKSMLKDVQTLDVETNSILVAICEGRLDARVIAATRCYTEMEGFNHADVAKKNPAAGALCEVVLNTVEYYNLMENAQPKLQSLGLAKAEHAESSETCSKASANLKQYEAELESAQNECKIITDDKNMLLNEAVELQKSLEQAQRLLTAIDYDQKFWAEQVEELKQMESVLLGSVLIASSFVSFMGPMASAVRRDFTKEFVHILNSNGIACGGKSPDPLRVVMRQSMKLKWAQQGLSMDRSAQENAAIISTTMRTPLLIDPDSHFSQWCSDCTSTKVLRISVGDRATDEMDTPLRSSLIHAVESGLTVILHQVDKGVEPIVMQLAAKQTYDRGQKIVIKLGEKEVEYDPLFRLYLVTKLTTVLIPAELQAISTLVDCTPSDQGITEGFLRIIAQRRDSKSHELMSNCIFARDNLALKLAKLSDDVLQKLLTVQGNILSDASVIGRLEKISHERQLITTKKNANLDQIEISDAICAPYRQLADKCFSLYSLALELKKIDPFYQYSLESFHSVLADATAQEEVVPHGGYIHVREFIKIGRSSNPYKRFRLMSTVVKFGLKGLLKRGRVHEVELKEQTPADSETDNETLTPRVTLKVCRFVQRGLIVRDQLIFATLFAMRNMLETGAVTTQEVDTLCKLGFGPNDVSEDSAVSGRQLCKMPAIVQTFLSERNWQSVCTLEDLPGLQSLTQDVEASHERWKRWKEEAQPEKVMLPNVYGRTASAFQRLLILRAIRPDRMEEGFRKFVEESLGLDYVSELEPDKNPLEDQYRISSPRMPLLLNCTAGPEECTKHLMTLIRKKHCGSRVVYCKHGNLSGNLAQADFERSMRMGQWLVLFDAEAQPQWLETLDYILQSTSTIVNDGFRAFILFNSNSQQRTHSLPGYLLTIAMKLTYEAPTSLRAHIVKALAVFDKEDFMQPVRVLPKGLNPGGHDMDMSSRHEKLEHFATALCVCHAHLVFRNRFFGVGWTRPYDFSLDILEMAGNCLFNFFTAPKTSLKTLIAELYEGIYGSIITNYHDMRIACQSIHDVIVRGDNKKSEILPGVRNKDDMTYGEYIQYIRDSDALDDIAVMGIHRNVQMNFALQDADKMVSCLATVLNPDRNWHNHFAIGRGRGNLLKSVGEACDNISELLEQLPINFEVPNVRDEIQKLGALQKPLGYVLLQEVTRLNRVFDLVRSTLDAIQVFHPPTSMPITQNVSNVR